MALRVKISPAEDVPGQWLAHCLDFGVMTQGDSPQHALEMVIEAVTMVIEDDREKGFNPHCRVLTDPEEEWAVFLDGFEV